MNKKIYRNLIIILVAVIVLSALFIILERSDIQFYKIDDRMEISEFVEVNDYEGENFSSLDDFRENSIKGPQYINKETYTLEITGLVENPRSYTYDEIINNFNSYKKVAKLNCVEGWSVNILWEGPLVSDIINQAKVQEAASTIIFHAYDGYITSFPIEYITDNNIIMAFKMNDEIMLPERGFPFQLVAESKWGYKWIKWITKIELSDNLDYQGYWESRGYSNSGNLDESRYEN